MLNHHPYMPTERLQPGDVLITSGDTVLDVLPGRAFGVVTVTVLRESGRVASFDLIAGATVNIDRHDTVVVCPSCLKDRRLTLYPVKDNGLVDDSLCDVCRYEIGQGR